MQSGVNRVGHQKIDGRDKSSNAGKSGESTQHTTHTRLHCSTPFSQQSVSEREREREGKMEHGTDVLMDQRRNPPQNNCWISADIYNTLPSIPCRNNVERERVKMDRHIALERRSQAHHSFYLFFFMFFLSIPFFDYIIIPPFLPPSIRRRVVVFGWVDPGVRDDFQTLMMMMGI
jgi:hypothetical protein